MDQTTTLQLHAKGRRAWNDWAKTLLDRREELEEAGEFDQQACANFSNHHFTSYAGFAGYIFPGDAKFEQARFAENATFDNSTFHRRAIFHNAVFSGVTRFQRSTFLDLVSFHDTVFWKHADFEDAKFLGYTLFNDSTFATIATFSNATFSKRVEFNAAAINKCANFFYSTFSGEVSFFETQFGGDAEFQGSRFESGTCFESSKFRGDADFTAIKVTSSFLLSEVFFQRPPNFNQAQFSEAPRLDDIRIYLSSLGELVRSVVTEVRNDKTKSLAIWNVPIRHLATRHGHPSAWNSLERLAKQGNDFQRELEFFRRGMRARRWTAYKPWSLVFWINVAYQVLSDYGMSVARPLLFWMAGVAGTTWGVLVAHVMRSDGVEAKTKFTVGVRTVVEKGLSEILENGSGLTCIDGSGNGWAAALSIAMDKAILGLSIPAGKLAQSYACLFDIENGPSEQAGHDLTLRPIYPDVVVAIGIIEFVWSAVTLFLVGLALRNHFRIR